LAVGKLSKKGELQTVGLDLGDRFTAVCVLTEAGEVIERSRCSTTRQGLRQRFEGKAKLRVALEAGTHSNWVSESLESWGHEVIVANPRQVYWIFKNTKKCDRVDAESLARLARADVNLLSPIQHRSAQAQAHRAVLSSRDALVRSRTALINHARGVVKTMGERLPSCSSAAFVHKALAQVPAAVGEALAPLFQVLESLNAQIHEYERQVKRLCEQTYPQTQRLCQVNGVGQLTALTYIVTLETASRFARSRSVGAFLGLSPRSDQSGERQGQLGISKRGDALLRRLLVSSAQYILGPFGKDSDLRRFGLALAQRGGRAGKKRAVVAVARKLAVLLHSLWRTAQVYDPLRQTHLAATAVSG
jgi:transposase